VRPCVKTKTINTLEIQLYSTRLWSKVPSSFKVCMNSFHLWLPESCLLLPLCLSHLWFIYLFLSLNFKLLRGRCLSHPFVYTGSASIQRRNTTNIWLS
jgi:hypothetical protein